MPPTTGLTSAAAALRYWERRQEVASNNLANVSTDGFKAERVFAEMLGDATPAARTATDVRSGTLRETRNPLDVAVAGEGFLVVSTPGGERFARGGSLQLDAGRRLVDPAGNAVLGENGPIVVPAGSVSIDRGGQIAAGLGQRLFAIHQSRVGHFAELPHKSCCNFCHKKCCAETCG